MPVSPGSPVAQISSKRLMSGLARVRILDHERRARLFDVEAVQEMPAVDDDERVGAPLCASAPVL